MLLAAPRRSCSRALALPGPPPVPVLPPSLPSVAPGSCGGGGRGVGFRGARCRGLLLPPALPGGRGKFLRRASPSFWAVRGWLPLGFSCGAAEHHHLLFRQHTGAGAASKQHRQQTPAASPTKKSTLEAPADLLA